MKIREAKKEEYEIIADFQVRMAKETEDLLLDAKVVRLGVRSVFDDPAKGFYLVVEEQGKLIASLMITYEWSDWRAKTVWWIQSLLVIPAYRKQGIFRKMFEYLVDLVEDDPEVAGIRLYVDRSNTNAQKVYQALGMDGDHYRFFEWME